MVEYLILNVQWWHWIIFGLILIVSEIIVPLFVVIWFGFSAIIVGFITLLFLLSFMGQFSLWILFSIILLFVWFKYFRPKTLTESGQADFRLKTKGIVLEEIPHAGRGKVRFDIPVLGSSEWPATADKTVEKGSIVRIIDVNGQLIKVEKDH